MTPMGPRAIDDSPKGGERVRVHQRLKTETLKLGRSVGKWEKVKSEKVGRGAASFAKATACQGGEEIKKDEWSDWGERHRR